MDIYKCPKSKIQKNFPLKILNILYNKLKFLLKDEGDCCKTETKKKGFSFLYFFYFKYIFIRIF